MTKLLDWHPAKLNQLGFVGRGRSRHRPRDAAFLYGGPYPFFQTGDIKAANLYLTDYTQTYSEAGLAQSKLWKAGTLCITIAANIAETAILAIDACFPDSVVGFVPDPEKADVRFVKYYIDTIKLQMQNVSRGTTQDNLSLDKLLMFDFRIPPLSRQRRIAGALSAYDELIENCQRRIRVLETMVRNLYREWFVNFRFPGSERQRYVSSSIGRLPNGWAVAPLGRITTKIGSGATPTGGKNSYKSYGVPLIRSLNIYDYRFEPSDLAFIDDQQAADLDHVTVQRDDILLNITGASVGRCALAPSYLLPARVNQHVAIIRVDPDIASPHYVLDAINSNNRKAQLMALAQGGATREALTKDTISNFEVAIPPKGLVDLYGQLSRGIHGQREILMRKIDCLRRTRELLLPRLLSGQVDLKIA